MTVRVFEDRGAAKLNEAVVVGRIQSVGGVQVVVTNQDDVGKLVMQFENQRTGEAILTDKDTARTAENTGYTGNDSDLAFSGQVLNNLPVVPKSLVITPATSGPVVYDRDGDGILYTQDADEDVAGAIDYFTGAVTLEYPEGKAPNGQLDADYVSQGTTIAPRGKRTFGIANVIRRIPWWSVPLPISRRACQ